MAVTLLSDHSVSVSFLPSTMCVVSMTANQNLASSIAFLIPLPRCHQRNGQVEPGRLETLNCVH